MQQQVVEEIAKYLGVSTQDIDLSLSLTEDLGLSPVEMSDLLSSLSTRFKVTFEPAEIENIKTVNDLVIMVEDLSLEE